MSMRLAFLVAASPLALLASPAIAQDEGWVAEEVLAGPEVGADYVEIEPYSDPIVQDIGDPQDAGASYAYATEEAGEDSSSYVEYAEDEVVVEEYHTARRAIEPGHAMHREHHSGPRPAPQLAYGPEERAEWLAQCRALHARPVEPVYVEQERQRNGGVIGGLLGAVTGGVVGNRVADGDRLLGTVVGAGLGGLAGAVIGSAIDSAARDRADERAVVYREDPPGFDYCEAYLLNYERGYGVPTQLTYVPVAVAPVTATTYREHEHRGERRVIVEEVDVEAAPAPRPAPRRPAPPRTGDKRTPIR